jgi:hypothetical protein
MEVRLLARSQLVDSLSIYLDRIPATPCTHNSSFYHSCVSTTLERGPARLPPLRFVEQFNAASRSYPLTIRRFVLGAGLDNNKDSCGYHTGSNLVFYNKCFAGANTKY